MPRSASPTTHTACRSLLQKAIRRGHVALSRSLVQHLIQAGDATWLSRRIPVIAFEECWHVMADLGAIRDREAMMDAVEMIATATKVKDAAGLGTLAYALSEDDRSVLSRGTEDREVRLVAAAIRRPDDFWDWSLRVAETERALFLVHAAQRSYRRGGWPWDRAFMLAAAYLAVTHGVPDTARSARPPVACPPWIGLDKHTRVGRAALREAAKRSGSRWRQITWASFYFESARVNEIRHSPWWEREVSWRLDRTGLQPEEARSLWEWVRPIVLDILGTACEAMADHLSIDEKVVQPALF